MRLLAPLALAALAVASAPGHAAYFQPHVGTGTAEFRWWGTPECLSQQIHAEITSYSDGLADTSHDLFLWIGAVSTDEDPFCNVPSVWLVGVQGSPTTGFRYEDPCEVVTIGPLGPATAVRTEDVCLGRSYEGVVAFVV